MNLSPEGLSKLKTLEGFKALPYKDSGGRFSAGYGHLIISIDNIPLNVPITEERASELLSKDVALAERAVNSFVTSTINQNQFDALVLFTYNVGVANFTMSSLLRLVNECDFDGASKEFLKWDKVHTSQGMFITIAGLLNRREAEQSLFLTPVSDIQNA